MPPYLRIVTEIRRRIDAGELRPGDRVPSTRQITEEWGVAIATASKALNVLAQEGVVRAVPRVGTVVAAREPARRRQPDGELSRERVVRAAIEIADAQGFAALSMRAVAAELGVATMSLYRHVRSKDELALLMADAVFEPDLLPSTAPSTWREHLELSARLQWAIYRKHPWLAQVVSLTRPQPLPNLLRFADWSLRGMKALGLDTAGTMHAHITLFGYVRGTAVNLEWEAEAQQETGMTADQWLDTQDFAAVMTSGHYPALTDLVAHADFDLDLDTLFEFGLQRLLDGYGLV